MSDLAAQLELSRRLYDELFSQTEQLRADLQQAQEELREKKLELAVAYGGSHQRQEQDEWFSALDKVKAERQQAIDALRRAHGQLVAHCCGGEECRVHDEIRDALVKLGEQP